MSTFWGTVHNPVFLTAELFDKDRKTIIEHIGNVFKEGELTEKSVCWKFQHTAKLRMGKIYHDKMENVRKNRTVEKEGYNLYHSLQWKPLMDKNSACAKIAQAQKEERLVYIFDKK